MHTVEGESEAVVEGGGGEGDALERTDGEDGRGRGEMAGAGHLGGGEFDVADGGRWRKVCRARGINFSEEEICGEEFADDLFAFDDE